MTYSIVARDPVNGDLGVVVAVVAGKLLGITTDNVALVFGVFGVVFVVCGVVALALNRHAEEKL